LTVYDERAKLILSIIARLGVPKVKIRSCFAFFLLALALVSCSPKEYQKKSSFASRDNTKMTIVGNTVSSKALEKVITDFRKLYPNCDIEYEYLQNYSKNLAKRLENNETIDLFLTNNIQGDSPSLPYALDLKTAGKAVDLSYTYDGLIKNFTYQDHLYAIPMGAEIRGLFVNKTLLASLSLKTPTNYQELLHCCEVLKAAGYVPLQGNPNSFGQKLMYPYVCDLIGNSKSYADVYASVNRADVGVSELFRNPVSRLYELVEKGYYDYKYVETNNGKFLTGSQDGVCLGFLGIVIGKNQEGRQVHDKTDVAFIAEPMSLKTSLDKYKEDFHSDVEYEFILAPVGDEGGFAYMSPSEGIAVNKNGQNVDWALEFLNFLFSRQENSVYAKENSIIPNTKDAETYINKTFNMKGTRVTQLGQVSFDYVFYNVINKTLVDVSKANAPKYMRQDGTMYPLSHYMEGLESGFEKQRKKE